MNNAPLVISHRLSAANMPPMEKVMPSHLTLQEILLVGNCSDQVRHGDSYTESSNRWRQAQVMPHY